ncbi:MAG TPA: DUF4332 domain-containing protein [Anaerolineae bacterium]|nr:DUF4332 domain-containing protein [Anaerolineae bacterium]HNU04537.1 DUF4332 domain-containing protein [Anaerolineae bacterium]
MEAIAALLGLGVAAAAPFVPGLRSVAKAVVKGGMAVADATATVAAVVAEEVGDLAAHLRADEAAAETTPVDASDAGTAAAARAEDVAAPSGLAAAAAGAEAPLVAYELTDVHGVGPKSAALLQAAGITTVAQLAAAPIDQLKTILEQAGPRYRVIDPSAWPANAQALLATPPPLPKAFDDSDLLQIDGVGPKTAALLVDAGITSVSQLAATPITQLQAVLDQAGPRYRIVDPTAWPAKAQALLPTT